MMTREEIVAQIKERLGAKIVDFHEKSAKRYYVEVRPEDVPEATRLIHKELGARFQIASGVDTPTAIEILYHWAFDQQGFVVTIRTKLDREHPEIESVSSICTGTEWIEREMWELLGVHFKNHPDLRHLLLDDNWPEGKYPLRRDYEK
ncbi:MAG: NADH-quinone oxidoreductase subunit C [Verrucomicrobia bacterium]|nr:NADH-quinone oxidoreductase subunit C [Verrucomicrobiota bacterium]MBU1909017.1 NADH-quinone oxidoreductase subunit C [Verrucomicrobiota bacterium]